MEKLDKERCQELLNFWQNELRMKDWNIDLNVNVPRSSFAKLGCAGECCWNDMTRTATINMADIATLNDDELLGYDMEQTLIHEMLHIKFCFVTDFTNEVDSLSDRLNHIIIDDLATSLAKLHHQVEGYKNEKDND